MGLDNSALDTWFFVFSRCLLCGGAEGGSFPFLWFFVWLILLNLWASLPLMLWKVNLWSISLSCYHSWTMSCPNKTKITVFLNKTSVRVYPQSYHSFSHIQHPYVQWLWNNTLYWCCTSTKYFSFLLVIFIFSYIFSARLWRSSISSHVIICRYIDMMINLQMLLFQHMTLYINIWRSNQGFESGWL